jgi:hypothetical protein
MSIRHGLALLAIALTAGTASSEPQPGEVFREFTYGSRFHELDPGARNPDAQFLRAGSGLPRGLDIDDLSGATRAEGVVEYWGGHIGTGGQRFRANGHDWIELPQPEGTKTAPQCYYRTLRRATVPIPLEELRLGRNAFQFTAGPQLCHGFEWGFYWVYAFTVRVYYGPGRASVEAEIASPLPGETIGENPRLTVRTAKLERVVPGQVRRVDFVGRFRDFDWDGDGHFRDWQYLYERGTIRHHIGTATEPPFSVVWDTTWVPDQEQPVELLARVTDSYGVTVVTRPVTVTLSRSGRSVRMFTSEDVPEAMGARVGQRAAATIDLGDALAGAARARLVLSTWSAAHADEIAVNGSRLVDRVGAVHDHSLDSIAVPLTLLRPGANTVSVFSRTEHHAAEVNWPGPVLLIEHRPAPAVSTQASEADARSPRYRVPLEANPGPFQREDGVVEAEIDFAARLRSLGETGRFDPASLRVIEGGTGSAVPFQFDPEPEDPARGTLVLEAPGVTPPHETRRFEVGFDVAGRGLAEATGPALQVEELVHTGQPSLRIVTPGATYVYHREGAGFASLLDREGFDWVSYRPGHGPGGEYRGIPNLGAFAHPGYSGDQGSTTEILARGPLRSSVRSVRHDGAWACRWDVYRRFARLTVLEAAGPFWFLYEGTPGGALDWDRDYVVLSSGERRPITQDWSGDLPGPEWVYFGDDARPRVLFLAHADDDANDQFWQMDGEMTVFGFGREYRCCGSYLRGPRSFLIGFAESTAHAEIRRVIESAFEPWRVRLGAARVAE